MISLRPALPTDAALLLALEEAGMRAKAEALWGHWRPSATVSTLDISGHEMVLSDGQAVGCVATVRHADHLHLRKLYIAETARHRGIGSATLAEKMQEAERLCLPLRLSVLTTNAAALRFYLRHGFDRTSASDERIWLQRPPRAAISPPASG